MSVTGMQGARYRHDWVKLPKLSLSKGFRIRSASKDRQNNDGATASMRRKKDPASCHPVPLLVIPGRAPVRTGDLNLSVSLSFADIEFPGSSLCSARE